jgi:tRNA threonylcarbamoyl adenosine modification protein YeaZ
MRLLVIDTSGPECAAGIYDAEALAVLAVRSETIGKGHAEVLPGMIEAIVKESGVPLAALDRIVVTIGPGSFTGIRVGVAMARGLALSLGVAAVGVTTLQVVAQQALGQDKPVLALIDARREELYAQLFLADGSTSGEPVALDYDQARALGKQHGALLAGSGALILLGEASPQIDRMPLDVIGAIGARLAETVKASPLYIRGADAKPQTGFAVQHA